MNSFCLSLQKVPVPSRTHTTEQNGQSRSGRHPLSFPIKGHFQSIMNFYIETKTPKYFTTIFKKKKMRCDEIEAARNVGE